MGEATSHTRTQKVRAFLILLRLFYVLLMVPFFVLYGAVFANTTNNWGIVPVAMLCPMLILFASHCDNAASDYKSGFDRLDGGSRAKPFDSACEILPTGILSINQVWLSGLLLYIAGGLVAIFLAFFSSPLFLVLLVMGLTSALSYNHYMKERGLGEVSLFVGVIGVPMVGYIAVTRSLTPTAFLISVIPTFFIVAYSTFHQFFDVLANPSNRIRNLAAFLHKSTFRLPLYLFSSFLFILLYHILLISTGILDPKSFLAVLATPLKVFAVFEMNKNVIRAYKMCILTMFVYVGLMMIGQLI